MAWVQSNSRRSIESLRYSTMKRSHPLQRKKLNTTQSSQTLSSQLWTGSRQCSTIMITPKPFLTQQFTRTLKWWFNSLYSTTQGTTTSARLCLYPRNSAPLLHTPLSTLQVSSLGTTKHHIAACFQTKSRKKASSLSIMRWLTTWARKGTRLEALLGPVCSTMMILTRSARRQNRNS